MPRHHNRAILANISDANLDPAKKYVNIDKSGKLVVDNSNKKLLQAAIEDSSSTNVSKSLIKSDELTTILLEEESIMSVLDLDVNDNLTEKLSVPEHVNVAFLEPLESPPSISVKKTKTKTKTKK